MSRRSKTETLEEHPGHAWDEAPELSITRTITARLHPVCEWLLRGIRRDIAAEDLLSNLNERLCDELDAPIWRSSLNLHTFHPEVFVRNLVWTRGEGCKSEIVSHVDTLRPIFRDSPVALIYDGSGPIRRRLSGPGAVLDFPILRELADQGATDYLIMPLDFSDGRRTFVSFTTRATGGFSDSDIESLVETAPYLSLRVELESSNFAKASLLQLYLGRSAASRVLAGNFKRGHGQRIDAAIWYCDLRNFTAFTAQSDPDLVVELLDRYFELVANAIRREGGEILKFIGDAVLACFEFSELGGPTGAADSALQAARAALTSIHDWNNAGLSPHRTIDVGIALHTGSVLFGNIGSRERLDFTVIGRAINEACRIEPLCKSQGVPLVLSAEFASHATAEDLRSLGQHPLRGVEELREVFTLAELMPCSGG